MTRKQIRCVMLCIASLMQVGSVHSQSAARKPATPAPNADSVANPAQSLRENYQKLADDVEATLRKDVLDAWFPRTVDKERGGFRAYFTRQWVPGAQSGGKFSVFQGRMTWIASQLAMRRPELKERFLPIAQHGHQYLNDTLWDKQYGGFYWGLD